MTHVPDVLHWSPRSAGHGDCAVAALELACGVSYETALAACINVVPAALKRGLTLKEMQKAATFLGFVTKRRRKFDLEEDTGILCVIDPKDASSEHAVYLWEGRIIEPMSDRCQLWLSAPAFLAHYQYKATTLLALEKE